MSLSIEFSLDFEAEEVTITYDYAIILTITKLDDNEYKYSGFSKLDDEYISAKLKKFGIDLLNLE